MQMSCPCCHAHISLEAALQDEAGRELVAMMAALSAELARPLVHYLGFFRPAKQQLGWGRALRLAREVRALEADVWRLQLGLNEAARTLDEKRNHGNWKPLGNHNYLLRCLESVAAQAGPRRATAVAEAAPSAAPAARSNSGRALVTLEGMKV